MRLPNTAASLWLFLWLFFSGCVFLVASNLFWELSRADFWVWVALAGLLTVLLTVFPALDRIRLDAVDGSG